MTGPATNGRREHVVEDPLSHSQGIDLQRPRPYDIGVNKLLLAIIESGMRDYLYYPEFRDEVREWVDDHADDSVFSFATICDQLGMNVVVMRAGLRRWMAKIDIHEYAAARSNGRFLRVRGLVTNNRPRHRGPYGPRKARQVTENEVGER